MADFCIVAVKYSADGKHIDSVQVREEKPNKVPSLGDLRTVARPFVADLIRLGKVSFQTRFKNAKGTYDLGANVHVIDDVYLSTDRNNNKRDNLGALPTF